MAQVTGTYSQYDAKGLREDLWDHDFTQSHLLIHLSYSGIGKEKTALFYMNGKLTL